MKLYFVALCDYFVIGDDEMPGKNAYTNEAIRHLEVSDARGGHSRYSSRGSFAAEGLLRAENLVQANRLLENLLEMTNIKYRCVVFYYEKSWDDRWVI